MPKKKKTIEKTVVAGPNGHKPEKWLKVESNI